MHLSCLNCPRPGHFPPLRLQLESCREQQAAAAAEKQHLEAELRELRAAAQHNGSSGDSGAADAAAEDGDEGHADAQELIAVLRQQLQEAHEAAARVRPGRPGAAGLLLAAPCHASRRAGVVLVSQPAQHNMGHAGSLLDSYQAWCWGAHPRHRCRALPMHRPCARPATRSRHMPCALQARREEQTMREGNARLLKSARAKIDQLKRWAHARSPTASSACVHVCGHRCTEAEMTD